MSRFIDGLEQRAENLLPEPVHRYFRQGARDGVTTSEAVAAWDSLRFMPRVLRDVTQVQTGTSLLGSYVNTPFAVAPTSMQRAADPDGEVAMARAAHASGALMVLSSNSGSTVEDVAATGVDWWLQMYVTAERRTSLPLLQRAADAGAKAIVLTVDTPVVGAKDHGTGPTVWDVAEPDWLRANFPPEYGDAAGDEKATDLGPQDVDWIAQSTGLPVVVKGVLRPDDARRCVEAGAKAVWVSNHGGRQLDYSASTASCLAGVADAVATSAEVYVDGGIRCARHALAALALGARGVFLGRLPLFALAVDGSDGVRRMFTELGEELVDVLRLAGCPSVTRVPADVLAPRRDPV
jgi:4-hydroxymandelate oxidase